LNSSQFRNLWCVKSNIIIIIYMCNDSNKSVQDRQGSESTFSDHKTKHQIF